MRTARIRVPGSTSNLGAAFDAAGLALQLYLQLEVRELQTPGLRIEAEGEDAQLIPRDESNLVVRVMSDTAARHGAALPGFELRVHNEIPITKGLGSSAAACVAGAAAASYLCRLHLPHEALLREVAEREGHPDNAAPALWGGLVTSISGDTVYCARAEFPPEWSVVAVTPEFALETRRARGVLPAQVPRSAAVFNVQRAAFLMAQLVRGRREGLREAMKDMLHQPYRCPLLPGLAEILAMNDMDGLLGVALSGAGSTVVAFADANEVAIGASIRDVFTRHGLASRTRILKADSCGLCVEDTTSAR
jgi:homoserine kinase